MTTKKKAPVNKTIHVTESVYRALNRLAEENQRINEVIVALLKNKQ